MRKVSAVVALAAAVLAGGAWGQALAGTAYTDASGGASVSPASESYRIGPQDNIDVEVFQIPDLSKSGEVEEDGSFRLPLIGQVQAAGHTTGELADEIEAKLKASYVKNPQVTVTVKDSASRRVTIDGSVIQPGIYPLTGRTTLLQAVALAKGPDPHEANLHRVSIFREVNGARQGTTYDLSAIRTGKAADPEVLPDDVVVVENSKGRTLLHDISGALPILSIFRLF